MTTIHKETVDKIIALLLAVPEVERRESALAGGKQSVFLHRMWLRYARAP